MNSLNGNKASGDMGLVLFSPVFFIVSHLFGIAPAYPEVYSFISVLPSRAFLMVTWSA